ncbi:MAG: glycogen synthase GlgA [Planctomycetota bacterium]
MKIVFVTSEMVPFAKTGGLADVAGALPDQIRNRGHEVLSFLPYYQDVEAKGFPVEDAGIGLSIPLGDKTVAGRVLRLAGTPAGGEILFIDLHRFFKREGLYQIEGKDHPDNASRFIAFSRAVLDAVATRGFEPDLFHVNDWQSALVPVYLKTLYASKGGGMAGSLLTLHNLGYQGLFPKSEWPRTGLPKRHFQWQELEFFGKINFLKGGIVFADAINTVSKTYAKEIQTETYGTGLDGVLRDRAADLFGVVNGIDTEVWNPETDPHLAGQYGPEDLSGKKRCKEALREEAGLGGGEAPLIGMITRLAPQKGIDLVIENLDALIDLGVQLVLLGTGDPKIHRLLEKAEKDYPGRVRAFLTFDNALAHRIEAGADLFLMPSRYEPCGLNQLMSLRYGTVPIVRRTGGLTDTVVDATPEALARGEATGFCFDAAKGPAMLEACFRAVEVYRDRTLWEGLLRTGMAQDWSWNRAAGEYIAIYERILAGR